MKKLTSLLFVFGFIFSVFAFNAGTAHADPLPGCNSEDGYSITTGRACNKYWPDGCTSTSGYSSTTGEKCDSYWDFDDDDESSDYLIFTRDLTIGSTGEDVSRLQEFLKERGYYFGKIDGKFGRNFRTSKTRQAVIAFQRANGLPRTGIVDAATRAVLNREINGDGGNYGTELTIASVFPGSGSVGTKVEIHGTGFYGFSANLNEGVQYIIKAYFDSNNDGAVERTLTLNSWDIKNYIRIGKLQIINDNLMVINIPNIVSGNYSMSIAINGQDKFADFSFIVTSGNASAPTISGVSGPQTLKVNETGTWTVKASSKDGGNLEYNVNWGEYDSAAGIAGAARFATQQSATFTHKYTQAGNYKVTFLVNNSTGKTAETSITVKVGEAEKFAILPRVYPSGILTSGTKDVVVQFDTTKPAKCIYFNMDATGFPGAAVTLAADRTNTHFKFIHPVYNGVTYNLTVSCGEIGSLDNVEPTIWRIPFTIATTQPSITVLSPNGGETYKVGEQITVKWKSENWSSDKKVVVVLDSAPGSGIDGYNMSGSNGIQNDGVETFTLPNRSDFIGKFKVRVGTVYGPVNNESYGPEDSSDNYFTITAPTTQSSITVLSPNGGETWVKGTKYRISWSSNLGDPTPFDITLVTDPFFKYPIVKNLYGSSYDWTVPLDNNLSGSYLIRICQTGTDICSKNSTPFTITAPTIQPLTITTPSLLPNAKAGQPYSVALNATGGAITETGSYYSWIANNGLSGFPITGLGFNSSVGNPIYITGNPADVYIGGVKTTTPQTFIFTVTVSTNSPSYNSHSVTKQFTLTVDPATPTAPAPKISGIRGLNRTTGAYTDYQNIPASNYMVIWGTFPDSGNTVKVGDKTYSPDYARSGQMNVPIGPETGTFPVTITNANGTSNVFNVTIITPPSTTPTPTTSTFSISGKIVQSNGSPANAKVSAGGKDATTSSDGSYSVTGIPTNGPGVSLSSDGKTASVTINVEIIGTNIKSTWYGGASTSGNTNFGTFTMPAPTTSLIPRSSLSANVLDAVGDSSQNVAPAKFFFTRFLEEGARNSDVRELQKYLSKAGFYGGNIDGVFGPILKAALISFQQAHGLKADGIVGYEMRNFLNR